MIDVNLFGVIHGVHTFLPDLESNSDGGHIVNTASIAGLLGAPRTGAYAAAKFGVVGLTEVLAIELAWAGSKVGTTLLCPGAVRTNTKTSLRNRPAGAGGTSGLANVDIAESGRHRFIEPGEVGAMVVDAIRAGTRYVVTHPEWFEPVRRRHEAIAEAFTVRSRRVQPPGGDVPTVQEDQG
jgi:NAD(P)-dependent dehydrogenase (short-subunit alcohol dehydrogenase family)